MHSLKMKFFSLAAAGALCVSLAGCNLSTPATVGTIGGVEIPAGVYLLAQYNAYNTASGTAELATGETAQTSAVYNAAMTYVPQAMTVLGSEMDAGTAIYYGMSQLALPDDLASYGSGETNSLTDPLDEAGAGKWVKIDLGMYYMVARKLDPLTALTLDDVKAQYDLVAELKGDEVEAQLYEEGAALPHSLNAGAMKTYSAGKIRKN